jgi:hypothetical protein
VAASPFSFAVGSVSFQPSSVGGAVAGALGAGGGGAGGGGEGDEHAATTHAAAISRPARTPVDRNRITTNSMVAQRRRVPVGEGFAMRWIYFEQPARERSTSLRSSMQWGYGPFVVFSSTAATSCTPPPACAFGI